MENEQNIHNEVVTTPNVVEQTMHDTTVTPKTNPGFGIPQAIVTAAVIIGLALVFVFAPNKTASKPLNNKSYSALEMFAVNMGINADKFEACMESGETTQTVKDHSELAKPLGVEGTPTSIIMVSGTNQQIQIVGALPLESIKQVIDAGLDGKTLTLTEEQKPKAQTTILASDHIIGNPNAPIVIVEYSDSDCPYCQRFHNTMHQVKDAYGDKVAWVYRHYPLDGLHPKARMEAEASECVAKLSDDATFWKYLDAMFTINSSAS